MTKLKSKIVTLGIGFLILFNLILISDINGHTDHGVFISTNVWKVTDWNETELLNFWPVANVSAEKGFFLSYNVTHENQGNYSVPNIGNFSLGNLSLSTDNPTIASNLIFSIYPWNPGLITHTNWTWHEQEAVSASQGEGLQGSLDINGIDTSKSYTFGDYTRKVVEFVYRQDKPGNQNTSVIYDYETGILLYGFTEIFFDKMYFLELELFSSSLISSSNFEAPLNVNFSLINPIIIFGLIIIVSMHQKNKK